MDPVKRLNYFDGQFLRQGDFAAEQKYHLQKRRLLNLRLHTPGIVDGLKVLPVLANPRQIQISRGMAIDSAGNEIVLDGDTDPIDVKQPAGAWVYVSIRYDEQLTDLPTTGVRTATRITEAQVITVSTATPRDGSVVLAFFQMAPGGVLPAGPGGETLRVYAGSKLAPGSVDGNALGSKAVTRAALADGAVETDVIKNYAVTNVKIGGGAVSLGKLDDDLTARVSRAVTISQPFKSAQPTTTRGVFLTAQFTARGGPMLVTLSGSANLVGGPPMGACPLEIDCTIAGPRNTVAIVAASFLVRAGDTARYPVSGSVFQGSIDGPGTYNVSLSTGTRDATTAVDPAMDRFTMTIVEFW